MSYERAKSISEVFNGKNSQESVKRLGISSLGLLVVAGITWFTAEAPKVEFAKVATFLTENIPLGALSVYQLSRGYMQEKKEAIEEDRQAKLRALRAKFQGERNRFGLR